MPHDAEDAPREPTARFSRLPERVKPEDMVEEHETDRPLPIDGGHNAQNEFVIRHLLA